MPDSQAYRIIALNDDYCRNHVFRNIYLLVRYFTKNKGIILIICPKYNLWWRFFSWWEPPFTYYFCGFGIYFRTISFKSHSSFIIMFFFLCKKSQMATISSWLGTLTPGQLGEDNRPVHGEERETDRHPSINTHSHFIPPVPDYHARGRYTAILSTKNGVVSNNAVVLVINMDSGCEAFRR